MVTVPQVNAQVVADFEGGTTEGWFSEGDGVGYYEAGTGNPGGCFRVDDDATGNMNRAFAPLKFLGNWSMALASDSLQADIFLHPLATPYVAGNFVFRISGPGGQATAILSPEPPFDLWHTYKVSLSEGDWQLNSGSWSGLMQNVNTLIVTMEYINGDEYNRLDNVRLSFTPVLLPVNPVVCSGFEEGVFDGWHFLGTGGVSNQSTGGSPGRYLSISNGPATGYAYAPTKFLGIWTLLDSHAAEIVFDLKVSTAGTLLLNDAFLRILGPGGTAKIAMTGDIAQAFGQWHTFAYPVESSAWTIESGTWPQILAMVDELRLCVEFSSSTETVGIDDFCISNAPPVADFITDKTFTFVGDPVQFTDRSDKVPTGWTWSFGDGNVSGIQNPSHIYVQPGVFDVGLTAANFFGSHSKIIPGHITVAGFDDCDKFSDAFQSATIQPAWQMTNGTWSIASGYLRQTSNYYGTPLWDGCYAITGSPLWEDYFISADIHSTDNDQMGLAFRFQDTQNMYMFLWTLESPLRALYKWVNGTGTILASDNVGYVQNTWYQVKAGGYNGDISLWIDGTEIFRVADNTWPAGKAGLYCRGNQNTFYDNVVVACAIPDTLNPGSVTIGNGQAECFEATEVITTGGADQFMVGSGGSAILVAGQKVDMLPGTTVLPGGYLHAYITTNDNYCSGVMPGDASALAGRADKTGGSLQQVNHSGLFIYPNPSNGVFNIDTPGKNTATGAVLEVFDVVGRPVLKTADVQDGHARIDLSDYPPGVYLIRYLGSDEAVTARIVRY